MNKRNLLLGLFVIGLFAVYAVTTITPDFNNNAPNNTMGLTAEGDITFLNVTYMGMTLDNLSDNTMDVALYENVTIWYQVEGTTAPQKTDTYLEAMGDDGNVLDWTPGDGPYFTWEWSDTTHSYYSFEINVTKDNLAFKTYGADWESGDNHIIRTTTTYFGTPVFVNTTRSNDSALLDPDDFGFDVDQYTNVTFWYVVGNGTQADDFIELMGGFNNWRNTGESATFFTSAGDNGTAEWSLYYLELNITWTGVFEFKTRHGEDWANAEQLPGNANHQLLISGATLYEAFMADDAGNILHGDGQISGINVSNSFTDPITGEINTSTIVTYLVPSITIYFVVNVTNAQPSQVFGVGHNYVPDEGEAAVYSWSMNAQYDATLTALYADGNEYWSVALLVNRSASYEYKAMMQDPVGSTTQYEAGLGGANHMMRLEVLNEAPFHITDIVPTTVVEVVTTEVEVTDVVTSNITEMVTTEVEVEVITTVINDVTQVITNTVEVDKTVATTTVEEKASPGFEALAILFTITSLGAIIFLRRRKA
ncbi:MAG: hypothetical protein ACXAC7_13385 [Candidatus Hodarchaeales archaeon]|jgi:hypothetical protein